MKFTNGILAIMLITTFLSFSQKNKIITISNPLNTEREFETVEISKTALGLQPSDKLEKYRVKELGTSTYLISQCVDENGDGVKDDPTGATVTEEAEPMDDDDFDLEEIIRELEQELDGKNDPMTEEGEEKGEAKFESEKPEYVEEEEKPEAVAEGDEKAEPVSEEDEEIDLDEILREMGYGDDEKMEEGEEEKMEEGADEEKAELQADLEEAYKVIKSLKSTINEVNLLNAKLLYTNKLFRSYDLTNEQKHKVVETLDRTQNVREVKLVFSTLAESMKIGGTAKKVKQQTKMNESFASKKVASTAPKTIIAEGNSMAERFKKLANIK
jgi:hypothetical protein